MAKITIGEKPGPKPKPIKWDLFEQLCGLQCTQSEMSSFLKISVDTLSRRSQEHYNMPYADIYKKFSEIGKISLRRTQFILSRKNTAMAIWLGKNVLGQRDHPKEDDINIHELIEALRSASLSGGEKPSRPSVENGQPLQDQRSTGQVHTVPPELGSETAV